MARVLGFPFGQELVHPALDAILLDLDEEARATARVDPDFGWGPADSLWLQRDFDVHQDYLDLLARSYGAGGYLVDFLDSGTAVQQTSDWIRTETHDRITNALSSSSVSADRSSRS